MTRTLTVIVVTVALGLSACMDSGSTDPSGSTIPTVIEPGDPLLGAESYKAFCSNCHGRDLQGLAGLGKQLAPSEFVARSTEDELVALIIGGRSKDHPDNTTGVDMLPRAGNPTLSDQTIHDIAAYLKAHN